MIDLCCKTECADHACGTKNLSAYVQIKYNVCLEQFLFLICHLSEVCMHISLSKLNMELGCAG